MKRPLSILLLLALAASAFAAQQTLDGPDTLPQMRVKVNANFDELYSGKQAIDADLTAIADLTPTNDDVLQRKAGSWVNRTIAQLKTDLTLTKADVGLGNVDNTADANKQIPTTTYGSLPTCNGGAAGLQRFASDVGLMLCDGSAWQQLTSLSTTFSARGTPLFTGQTKRFTDIGSTGATLRAVGTSSAADWKVQAPTVAYSSAADITGTSGTAEQILMQTGLLPAGIFQSASLVEVQAGATKSSTSNTSTPRIRIGPDGTTTDPQVWTNAAAVAAANQTYGIAPWFKFTSTTAIAAVGRQDGAPFAGGNNNTQQTQTVADISSSQLRVSVSFANAATGYTMTQTSLRVVLHP